MPDLIRTVDATRYVTPLREGGSLPALVEASDSGMYVLKFRGAGQGPLALVAEVVAGEIGRALGLPVPELAFINVDEALGRNEADSEIRELLTASVGLNVGMDFLPGSAMFDPAAAFKPDPALASDVVWFDALITNVDRTARNPNLLVWHKALHLIDHGAALFFHHNWENLDERAESPFAMIRDHVLLPYATELDQTNERLRHRLTPATLENILAQVPDAWLLPESGAETPEAKRLAYRDYFLRRLEVSSKFTTEARNARG